jgi:hypothetical protein
MYTWRYRVYDSIETISIKYKREDERVEFAFNHSDCYTYMDLVITTCFVEILILFDLLYIHTLLIYTGTSLLISVQNQSEIPVTVACGKLRPG